MLIVLSFAFGYGLTRLEAPGEMRSNNGHMEAAWRDANVLYTIYKNVDDDYESCLFKFQEESLTSHGLVEFVRECLKEPKEERMEIYNEVSEEIIRDKLTNDMTYNWITCANETTDIIDRDEQNSYVRNLWSESYNNLRSKYEGEGLSESEAFGKAVSEADGTKNCVANHVGGAFFWFTIMTTIGYGNTSPVTNAGRLMVYVFGFLSIILFSGVIGHAGYIILTIVDDFFFCVGLRKFTEGVKSVLFWFVMMVLWLFVSAWLYIGYVTIGEGGSFSFLTDACWFAFISVTTVGFGDFHVPHDSIRVYDMIWMPFTLLIGFILLANFLIKLTDMVKDALAPRSRKLTIKLKSFYIPRSEVDEELTYLKTQDKTSSKDDLTNGKNLDESSLERKTDDNLPDETTHDNILPKHEPADGDDIDDFNFEIKQ